MENVHQELAQKYDFELNENGSDPVNRELLWKSDRKYVLPGISYHLVEEDQEMAVCVDLPVDFEGSGFSITDQLLEDITRLRILHGQVLNSIDQAPFQEGDDLSIRTFYRVPAIDENDLTHVDSLVGIVVDVYNK